MEGAEVDPEKGGRAKRPTQCWAGQPDLPCPPKGGRSGSPRNNLLHLFQGKYEERFLKDETISQQINSVESFPELHLSPEDEKPKQLLQRKLHVRSRPPSKPTIVRGVTYYKAQSTESENDIEEQRELGLQSRPAGWLAVSRNKASVRPPVLPCPLGMGGQSVWGHRGEEGGRRRWDGWYLTAVQPPSPAWGSSVVLLFHGKSLVLKERGHCFGLKHPASAPSQKVNASLLHMLALQIRLPHDILEGLCSGQGGRSGSELWLAALQLSKPLLMALATVRAGG